MIQSEVSILRRVKHPNIVLLIEEMDTHNDLYLVMELVKVNAVKSCIFILTFLKDYVLFYPNISFCTLLSRIKCSCHIPSCISLLTGTLSHPKYSFSRGVISLMQSSPLTNIQRETPAVCCSIWQVPSSTCTVSILSTET